MRPDASISTHFFSISAGLAVKVFMAYPSRRVLKKARF
jgi:hypothetical protein